jgi:hypothetical protein
MAPWSEPCGRPVASGDKNDQVKGAARQWCETTVERYVPEADHLRDKRTVLLRRTASGSRSIW